MTATVDPNDPGDLENFFEEAIADSIDMDWTSRVGARLILDRMKEHKLCVVTDDTMIPDVVTVETIRQINTDWYVDRGAYNDWSTFAADRLNAFLVARRTPAPAQQPDPATVEACARVADDELAARRADFKGDPLDNFTRGQINSSLRIADCIRALKDIPHAG